MNVALTPKLFIAVLALSLMGYLGNYLALPIAYGVSFIFGSIVSILAIVLLGLRWGLLVALITASCTFFLWNHPYAIVIFAMEALWVGLALRRGHTNLVLIDALYWLSLGSGLVIIFYGGVMGLDSQSVLMIVLKQSINGLFNTLVTSLLLYIPVIRQLRSQASTAYTYKNVIFNAIAVFLMVPTLSLLLFNNYRENIALNQQVATTVQAETLQLQDEISIWIENHLRAVNSIAQLPKSHQLSPSPSLQQELARIKELFPDLHNAYLADKNATTVAFYPAINVKGESTIGLNFADRDYFKALQKYGQPIVSDVFMGRGGITEPTFTISVPIMDGMTLSHFALGAINLQKMQKNLALHASKYSLTITLLDSRGKIVTSSDPTRQPLSETPQLTGSQLPTELANVYLHVPGKTNNISAMKVWKKAAYFSKAQIAKTSWTVQVEYPLAPMQAQLYLSAISGLGAIAFVFLPMLFIAFSLSNALTRPLQTLAKISKDLPTQMDGNENIVWPHSHIAEVEQLVLNFQQTSLALGDKIGTLNNRLALATDSAGIGVWDYYVQENKLIWDKWMYTLYGTSEDEFEGAYEAWEKGLHPDDMQRCKIELQQALDGETDFDSEFKVLWPTGEVRHIKANAQVQRDNSGQALRMIGINYDITERKQAIEKLEHAVKKAQVANDAKSEFLANMSHEIRTPMNGVIGMITQLLRTPLAPQQKTFASTVKTSAESLLNIINDILDFSKVEAGKLELEPINFDLTRMMQDFCTVMTFRSEEKGLLLTCPINTEQPIWLHGDAGRIRQILINLVGNAIKFTEHGEITISYTLLSQTNEKALLKFEICDHGIGLTQQQQNNLFDRFSQADGSTTRRYGGTGLGLAISKQLVELMDGEIGVNSTLGEGSVFWFTLNLQHGQQNQDELGPERIDSHQDNPLSTSQVLPKFSGRVLVVEDNPINQMVAQCQLEDFGIEVELADNGRIAVEKLATNRYDIVFMDCQMPVMDGFEASRSIRSAQSNALNPNVPIIAMTANVIKGDREKCLAAGMSDYISKPVDPEKLAQALHNWLPKA